MIYESDPFGNHGPRGIGPKRSGHKFKLEFGKQQWRENGMIRLAKLGELHRQGVCR